MLRRGYGSITLRVLAGILGYHGIQFAITLPMMGSQVQPGFRVVAGNDLWHEIALWILPAIGSLYTGFLFERIQSVTSWLVALGAMGCVATMDLLLGPMPNAFAALGSDPFWGVFAAYAVLTFAGFGQAHFGWIRPAGTRPDPPVHVPLRWPSAAVVWTAAGVLILSIVGMLTVSADVFTGDTEVNAAGDTVYGVHVEQAVRVVGESIMIAAMAALALTPVGGRARWASIVTASITVLLVTVGQVATGFAGVAGLVHASYLALGAVAGVYWAGIACAFEIRFLPWHAHLVQRHAARRARADAPDQSVAMPPP